ncbi:MFS transporter [Pleionea sp. CnH1-48]|uniref:MFS transporter n=1 Tax=Pleionea sp. CnH1-48 TaxID=2954494 RepID=UPI0020979B09|nr:MFS transporter [Pleionea sp. CnH1-48]MCO7223742.1 MFS transporter [Pleionea sp. CnH1-48]
MKDHQEQRHLYLTLFTGVFLLSVCNGSQTTLFGIRATMEGFSTLVTGLLMSSFFAGFLIGAIRGPIIIQRVGHVRTFGALTALASAALLLPPLFVDPWFWMLLRFVFGFCVSGIYVVNESWLNEKSTNQNRGQLLATYMMTIFIGVGSGQFLLQFTDPGSFVIFSVLSVLVSISAIPLLATADNAPEYRKPDKVPIRSLYETSQVGVIGAICAHGSMAMIFGMGPVFAASIALTPAQVSWFMAAFIFGGFVSQWPIGKLSDLMDRRWILFSCSLLASLLVIIVLPMVRDSLLMLLFTIFLIGAMILPLYSICVAYTHDSLKPEQRISATGTLILVAGIGSTSGPFTLSLIMNQWPRDGFYYGLFSLLLFFALFCLVRLIVRQRTRQYTKEHQLVAPTSTGQLVEDQEKK